MVNIKTEEMSDDTNLSTLTSVGGMLTEEAIEIYTEVIEKTEEMFDTNLSSLTSLGGMHEEANKICTEIDLIPTKLECDNTITNDEIGAVDALPQVALLRRVGGSDVNTAITGVLKRLLSNDLAHKYSWAGLKGKEPLKELRLVRLV